MHNIEQIIERLRADSNNLNFTGFVTNARVSDSLLCGEVWQHERANGFGLFADDHRIETSRIIDVQARGDSVWFETESGSRYGVLSFSPLGLIQLSKLRDVDGFPAWPPKPKYVDLPRNGKQKSQGIAKIIESRSNRIFTSSSSPDTLRHPFRPAKVPHLYERYKEQFDKSIRLIRLQSTSAPEEIQVEAPSIAEEPVGTSLLTGGAYDSVFKNADARSSVSECGPGWHSILETFCSLLRDRNERSDSSKAYIQRVTGKFGAMRILMSERPPDVQGWVHFAERQSGRTCEVCGSPGGQICEDGWQRTRCDQHRSEPAF